MDTICGIIIWNSFAATYCYYAKGNEWKDKLHQGMKLWRKVNAKIEYSHLFLSTALRGIYVTELAGITWACLVYTTTQEGLGLVITDYPFV